MRSSSVAVPMRTSSLPNNQYPTRVNRQSVQVGQTFAVEGAEDYREQIQKSIANQRDQAIRDLRNELNAFREQAKAEVAAQVQQLIEEAQAKALHLVEQAEAQRDQICEDAYNQGEQAGFAKGYDDGTARAEAEAVELLQSARVVLHGAYQAKERILKRFEPDAIGLIQTLCRTILNQAVQDSPEALVTMTSRALEVLNLTGRVKVVVSQSTLKAIREYSSETQEGLDALQRIEWIDDPQLGPTDIYVLSEEGHYILTPEKQLETLCAPLPKALKPAFTEERARLETLEASEPESLLNNLAQGPALDNIQESAQDSDSPYPVTQFLPDIPMANPDNTDDLSPTFDTGAQAEAQAALEAERHLQEEAAKAAAANIQETLSHSPLFEDSLSLPEPEFGLEEDTPSKPIRKDAGNTQAFEFPTFDGMEAINDSSKTELEE
ncbi:MAG: hypothetical protein K2X01_01825 [Cyanobacteria bacterium]|nr:hypothetical protein [Cyanobacteriota bacterium]